MKNLDVHTIELESQSKKDIKNKWIEKDLQKKLNFKLLQKVFNFIMRSMESHPNNQQIHLKALSLISYAFDFRELNFNVNKCIQLSMNLLLNSKDSDTNSMSVQICRKFINKTSISKRSQLFFDSIYIEKLIEIVKNSIYDSNHDIILIEEILSILVSATDLSPNVCEMFVEKGGIDLYLNILKVGLNLSKNLKDFKKLFTQNILLTI
jgi:hypothetical protein